VFRQAPEPAQLLASYGNPDLDLERSVQNVVGVEQRLAARVLLDVQAYWNLRDRLVASTSATVLRGGRRVPAVYDNSGTGRAYGLEVLLRHDVTEHLYGWLAYTLSRSERLDPATGQYSPASYDQTHNLVLVASYRFDGGWETGLRFRLTTGRPQTPVLGSTLDADTGLYRAATGPAGSARGPVFQQLDLRAEKTWTLQTWRLAAFLDVQNVYNAENPEAQLWDYRYGRSAPLRGLPVLPSLGLRASF
jgi:hypothetical protein